MVNTEAFILRLEIILEHYQLTASAFADKIGVQRSSISHLLAGRNKPSLEFVLKVVKSFPEVNLYWLLNGKGKFPQETKNSLADKPIYHKLTDKTVPTKKVEKIVIFYTDGSFKVYDKEYNSIA
ncbi:helix-turn-helix transcriptional regulator [Eudoraea chungangensis]|uniref:helix-turn-helix transcriptional regulator n=1 Tax=Eudoraea chungangensis TaxID=1481905 RepID=UPI0023ED0169|nr:helix-turn-helix transcriptional regulator [Eudoraea chungangensis]